MASHIYTHAGRSQLLSNTLQTSATAMWVQNSDRQAVSVKLKHHEAQWTRRFQGKMPAQLEL